MFKGIKTTNHFRTKSPPPTSNHLWDNFLTSQQGNIENKGFLVLRVRKFKKMAFLTLKHSNFYKRL